jgi:hypothetical protein
MRSSTLRHSIKSAVSSATGYRLKSLATYSVADDWLAEEHVRGATGEVLAVLVLDPADRWRSR